jgi:[acyl-carrier-protein] S-malonyltransferase
MTEFNSTTTAFMFPGQGSQALGMGQSLTNTYPEARETFEEADAILGYTLSKIAWSGPEESLNLTEHTQPALYVHALASYRVFKKLFPERKPAFMAGHSLGQLSALAAAGAYSFEDGLRLVQKRGELMARAGEETPGGMAAILTLEIPQMEEICAAASTAEELVEVANDNCPGQIVISGNNNALERAMAAAEAAGARKVVKLAVSVAAHSYLMDQAQDDFNAAVAETAIQVPEVPVIGNVAAQPLSSVEAIQADLQAQLTSRVRWTESINYVISQGVSTFIEIGTGSVLIGLVKRISHDATRINLGTPEEFSAYQA